MEENIFMRNQRTPALEDYLSYAAGSRENLGEMLPVAVYRMLEYSLKEELRARFGKEEQIALFRGAGRRAGAYFAKTYLDLNQDMDAFVSQLQRKLVEMKIGVLRIESIDDATGRIHLTVSEDADCSGLPILGETVCNYDEGFLSGVLTAYTGKPYSAVEVNCWATGDRVCRFCIEVDAK